MPYRNRDRVSLSPGEKILWNGKPKWSAFFVTKSFTMLPFAVLWLMLDMKSLVSLSKSGSLSLVIILFYALHLTPVWIWLGNVLTAGVRYKNTAYYLTNKRIIIQDGVWSVNETSLYYREIRNTHVKVDFIDKLFGVGDVCFDSDHYDAKGRTIKYVFEELKWPYDEYERIQRIVFNIKTDVEYPNALRPSENPGYNTDYKE